MLARAAALADTPSLSQALETGELSGDHVDVFAKVLASVDGGVKNGLTDAAPELIETAAASGSTPEEFAASLHTAAERIAADAGMSRFERQRRATRLRTWTDRASGMWRLSGTFDPESGARIHGRLEAAMAAMFATKTPSTTPTDSGEKQDHLRAIALLAVTTGSGSTSERRGADPKPAGSNTTTRNNNSEGLTNAADRGDPGGSVDFDHTDQADEWDLFARPLGADTKRFGRPGFTVVIDTTNLLPLCSQHHHAAHEGGWILTLGLDRSLTIELPNGQTMHTGPPGRHQEAA